MCYISNSASRRACVGDVREGLPIGGFAVGWVTGIVLVIIGLSCAWNKLSLIMASPPFVGIYGLGAGAFIVFIADAISRCKDTKN